MKLRQKVILAALLLSVTILPALALAYTLNNGTGDGTVSVGVDGYGAYGAEATGTSGARFDPFGVAVPRDSSLLIASSVAIRFDGTGTRTFLAAGTFGTHAGLDPPHPTPSGSLTSASSSFDYNNLHFDLVQSLNPVMSGGSQVGTVLTRTYTITNNDSGSQNFEMVHYLDADFKYSTEVFYDDDGGGLLTLNGIQVLFITDVVGDPGTYCDAYIAIDALGGIIPTSGRYELDSYSGLLTRMQNGSALDGTIYNDTDADNFINTGYDVTAALLNNYSLGSNASTTYTTHTYFISGVPNNLNSIPIPGTLLLLASGLLGLLGWRGRKHN